MSKSALKVIRWTTDHAEAEFGMNRRTIRNRLRTGGIEPGKDGKWSTQQICSAVYGDIDGEKLRLVREQADKLALENARSKREQINLAELAPMLERAIGATKASILAAANLELEDKDKILNRIADIWAVAFGVGEQAVEVVEASTPPDSQPVV